MVKVLEVVQPAMAPLALNVLELPVMNRSFRELLEERLRGIAIDMEFPGDLYPSDEVVAKLSAGTVLSLEELYANSFQLRYPWDLLKLNELLTGALSETINEGMIYPGAHIEGIIQLGCGSRILPGVFIEGNAVIGKNCKIGPNCYIRGNTVIGDDCHIGQAVEIKNSVLGNHVSIGHLSYAGDSVIDGNTNFGAGTIISNFRHDGRNHRCFAGGALRDTGRRKFGAIIGKNVHTGINTAIYPGRTISAGASTLPGSIVRKNI